MIEIVLSGTLLLAGLGIAGYTLRQMWQDWQAARPYEEFGEFRRALERRTRRG